MSSKLQIHRQELSVEPELADLERAALPCTTTCRATITARRHTQYISNRFRDALIVDGTYFIDAGKSSHEVKVGIEVQKFQPEIGTLTTRWATTDTYGGEPYRRYT